MIRADRIVPLLRDLGIKSGLIAAGASDAASVRRKFMENRAHGLNQYAFVELKNQALSVSGIAVQGSHIVSPRKAEFTSIPTNG